MQPRDPCPPGEEHWLLDTSLDEVYWRQAHWTGTHQGESHDVEKNHSLGPGTCFLFLALPLINRVTLDELLCLLSRLMSVGSDS